MKTSTASHLGSVTPGLLSRIVAATFGGYALAAVAALAMAMVLPGSRSEAVIASSMASFAIYCLAVMWVFAARSALRAWLGLMIPAAACAVLWWTLR